MKVTIKLYATFRNGRFKEELRDYTEGTTSRQIVAEVGIKEADLGMVLVNGRHASLEQSLNHGDNLALFPLLSGG